MSLSRRPAMTSTSSLVSRPHCSRTRPLNCFQSPSMVSQFMRSTLRISHLSVTGEASSMPHPRRRKSLENRLRQERDWDPPLQLFPHPCRGYKGPGLAGPRDPARSSSNRTSGSADLLRSGGLENLLRELPAVVVGIHPDENSTLRDLLVVELRLVLRNAQPDQSARQPTRRRTGSQAGYSRDERACR